LTVVIDEVCVTLIYALQ